MFNYIILGIVQGLTEFLPVSSSGHLVILQKLFAMSGEEVAISVILHLGTSLAVVIFFYKDILNLLRDGKSLALVLIVTLVTGVIGVMGKDFFESLFSSTFYVSIALMITGIILISTRGFLQGKRDDIEIKDAFTMGITQGIAIIPGISRSGITIATLLFRKINRNTAFKFSFIVSIPAILGAVLLEARKIDLSLQHNLSNLFAGFVFSFLSGLCALWLLRLVMNKSKFHYFGYYCIGVAITTLIFLR